MKYITSSILYNLVALKVYVLQVILTVISMQLLSYHLAVLRACNADCQELAKSVTVE